MRPLQGVKIIDFTQAHAGSLATMILADFGAEVLKIERKGVGDLARYWEPTKEGSSAYFSYLNRGKESISIDVSKEKGRDLVLELVKTADVVCENFKYGSMERLGLGYDVMQKVNPALIYASLNGFGQTGPDRHRIGLDLQMQALSGIMDRTGLPDGPPTKIGAAIGDQVSGIYLSMAINLALIHRKRTGLGQYIDISILDTLVSFLEASPVTLCLTGDVPARSGNMYPAIAPYDTFPTKDGYVSIGISTNDQWRRFCQALGMEDLLANPKYDSNEKRGMYYASELKGILTERISQYSKFDIERILRSEKLACGAVYTVSEAMETAHIQQRGMMIELSDPALGRVKMPGISIKLEGTPGYVSHGAPILGQNTQRYLAQLGLTAEEISALQEEQVIETARMG